METQKKIITVYASGVFDILHAGHLNILTKARVLGDRLVVGIQEDSAVFESKGYYPVLSTAERVAQMRALPFIDEVMTYYSGVDQTETLDKVKLNIMVQGDDWPLQADRSRVMEYLNSHDIKLILIPYTKEISDTEIKRRIRASINEK